MRKPIAEPRGSKQDEVSEAVEDDEVSEAEEDDDMSETEEEEEEVTFSQMFSLLKVSWFIS